MKIGAIILARLNSKRLPGKAMCELNGRPMIQYAIDACAAVNGIDQIILATTVEPEDDRLAEYADAIGIDCFRGSVDDVAGRFLGAMERHAFEAALRYNGDSPLNRPILLSHAVGRFRQEDCDLVSNVQGRTYPFGISAEVVGHAIMKSAYSSMTNPAHREHVTKFFYDFPSFARTIWLTAEASGMSGLQLAVDDRNDFERAGWIIERLQMPLLDAPLSSIVELARAFDEISAKGQKDRHSLQ